MFDLLPFDRSGNSLFSYFDNLEKNMLGGMNLSQFRTDILDKGDHFEMQAELPGFKKEDIHIDISGDTLTIHAENKLESQEKNGEYLRRERKYGTYSRSFDIHNIQQDGVTASYENGVLFLKLPKAAPPAPASRKISVE